MPSSWALGLVWGLALDTFWRGKSAAKTNPREWILAFMRRLFPYPNLTASASPDACSSSFFQAVATPVTLVTAPEPDIATVSKRASSSMLISYGDEGLVEETVAEELFFALSQGSDSVDLKQLQSLLLDELNLDMTQPELTRVFKSVDVNHNEVIDLDEFKLALCTGSPHAHFICSVAKAHSLYKQIGAWYDTLCLV